LELCRRRHNSKERRVDPQVVVGLLVDRGGFPLEIGCFEGNKAETATIIPIVTASFQARHSIEGMVVVADAGMLSSSNLRELDEAKLRFIVGSRVTKAPIDLASHFHWHGDAFTDGQVIDTLTPTPGSQHRQRPRAAGRTGVGARRARAVVAGRVGVLRETRSQGLQDADPAGEPRQGRRRRREGRPHTPVRQDQQRRPHPGRGSHWPGRAGSRA
jgi:hypothetical protein